MGKADLRGAGDTLLTQGQQFKFQILKQKFVKIAIGIPRLRNHRSATVIADLINGKTLAIVPLRQFLYKSLNCGSHHVSGTQNNQITSEMTHMYICISIVT